MPPAVCGGETLSGYSAPTYDCNSVRGGLMSNEISEFTTLMLKILSDAEELSKALELAKEALLKL